MSLERHHNNRTNNWSRDFSSLKRAKNLHNQKVVSDIQTIAASQLFNHAGNRDHKHLRRASSQPNMPPREQKSPLVPRYPIQNTSTNQPYYQKSYWERKSSVESTSSISEDETQNTQSENFETMYDIIQQRLQRHLRREEIFSRHEIQNICRELRRRALSTELEDGWQNSLSDLEIASGMKMEVLEAIYLLRNAHKSDLFSSQESVENSSERAISPTTKHSSQPSIPSLGKDILPNKYTHSSQPSISVTSIERAISPTNKPTTTTNRTQRLSVRPSTLELQTMQEGIQKPSPIQCKSRAQNRPDNHLHRSSKSAQSPSQTSSKLLHKTDELQSPNTFTNQQSYSQNPTNYSPAQSSFQFTFKPEESKTHKQPLTPQSPIAQGLIRKISPPSSKAFRKYSPPSQSAQPSNYLTGNDAPEQIVASKQPDSTPEFLNTHDTPSEKHSRVAQTPVKETLQTQKDVLIVHEAPEEIVASCQPISVPNPQLTHDAPKKTTHTSPQVEEEIITIEECAMDHEVPKEFAIPKISVRIMLTLSLSWLHVFSYLPRWSNCVRVP